MNKKICTHCKLDKLLSEFTIEKNKPRSKCKSCKSLINKQWRELNKDKITIKNKEKWQKRKTDKNYLARYRDYCRNNRESILQNKKESLSYLLSENKKLFFSSENYQDQQISFYIKNLRKIILRNHILKFISQKVKSLNSQKQNFSSLFEEKKTYSLYLPNFYNLVVG